MLFEEQRTGVDAGCMHRHPQITKQLRMSVIDWLYEVTVKKKISERSVMF